MKKKILIVCLITAILITVPITTMANKSTDLINRIPEKTDQNEIPYKEFEIPKVIDLSILELTEEEILEYEELIESLNTKSDELEQYSEVDLDFTELSIVEDKGLLGTISVPNLEDAISMTSTNNLFKLLGCLYLLYMMPIVAAFVALNIALCAEWGDDVPPGAPFDPCIWVITWTITLAGMREIYNNECRQNIGAFQEINTMIDSITSGEMVEISEITEAANTIEISSDCRCVQ